ncbi:MAG: AAA family ATPase [Planctomycetales bacterium]|nr:AAA family ATPase [Planctomycetales bacterium]
MTYWRYWQLNSAPFSSDSALFRGATVEEGLARIEFLIGNRRGVGSLLGASGVGKTSLLKHCAANPPAGAGIPNLEVMRISMLGMAPGELLCDVATRLLGGRRVPDAQGAWKTLCDYFQAASREGTQAVLLVDDTESCSAAAEADLTRLLAMSFPLTVIFAVESQLASAVSRNLFERSELQIELPGWETTQTAEFLAWACQSLGRSSPIFTDTAVERIQQLSFGIARRIVQLADLALVAGAVAQADFIDAECIEQVALELPKSTAA